jgi:hypothetical protein
LGVLFDQAGSARRQFSSPDENPTHVLNQEGSSIMSSNMPPVPPGNRSNKGPANSGRMNKQNNPETAENGSVKQLEKHHNAAEEGGSANIKQNTTNEGFYRGRQMG